MNRSPLLALGAAAALLPFFACAESELVANAEEDAGSEASTLDVSSTDDGATPDGGPDAPETETCSAGGFCQVPLPVKKPLLAVSAASFDDAWAIGKDFVIHWDGVSWKLVYQYSEYDNEDPQATFQGIWVAGHEDVWILGSTTLLRYSAIAGASAPTFRLAPSMGWGGGAGVGLFPTKDGFWRLGGSGVETYREEPDGGVVVVDGPTPPIEGFSIWGFGPDDIWVGGQVCPPGEDCPSHLPELPYGAMAHYDGSDWSVELLERGQRISAITGITAPDQTRQLWIWTGLSREDPLPTKSALRLHSAQADGGIGTPLFTQPLITDGTGVSPEGTSAPMWCSRVVASVVSPSTGWFTNGCLVYRWNGTALEHVRTAIGGLPPGKVNGIWAASADDVWIVGESIPKGTGAPPTGFALRRTRADGGQP
ncbi:MAG: hypothetical protein K0S65_6214 [Labilithrix sp.]|nr:hypothetical protein [Labilithrix sp.]